MLVQVSRSWEQGAQNESASINFRLRSRMEGVKTEIKTNSLTRAFHPVRSLCVCVFQCMWVCCEYMHVCVVSMWIVSAHVNEFVHMQACLCYVLCGWVMWVQVHICMTVWVCTGVLCIYAVVCYKCACVCNIACFNCTCMCTSVCAASVDVHVCVMSVLQVCCNCVTVSNVYTFMTLHVCVCAYKYAAYICANMSTCKYEYARVCCMGGCLCMVQVY